MDSSQVRLDLKVNCQLTQRKAAAQTNVIKKSTFNKWSCRWHDPCPCHPYPICYLSFCTYSGEQAYCSTSNAFVASTRLTLDRSENIWPSNAKRVQARIIKPNQQMPSCAHHSPATKALFTAHSVSSFVSSVTKSCGRSMKP